MDAKLNRYEKFSCRLSGNERGIALVTALLLLTVLAILVTVGTQWAATDIQRTGQYTKSRAAFYIAEAGIQTAVNQLNYESGAIPGAASNGFDDELNGTSSNWGPFTDIAYGNGTFTVTMKDNDSSSPTTDEDETVILTSVGTKDGVSVTIEALIHRGSYQSSHAILTDGGLDAGGNINVLGENGSIHSNEDVSINGNSATIEQGATAVLTCNGNGCTAGSVDPEDIPDMNPAPYKPYANYVLQSDGTILDQVTSITYTFSNPGGGNWIGNDAGATNGNALFDDIGLTGGSWRFNGSTIADGMYYVVGDAWVLNSPDPWQATIVADGYINFASNSNIQNYSGSGPMTNTQDIQNLLFVAGTDFKFTGSPSQTITGIMSAQEQLYISGTVTLNGYAIAANLYDVENLVTPDSTITGNMTITYNDGLPGPWLSNKVVILSWQEA